MQSQTNNERFRLKDLFRWNWSPKPLPKPQVDPDLEHLAPLTRSAESFRYSILSTEFWLSPDGQVREWMRNHTRLAVLLAIPAFLIIPIITFILWQLVSWMIALVSIVGKLIVFPILTVVAVIMII